MPELEQNHIRPLRDMCCAENNKIADYNETKKIMSFVNGSIIIFGYCATESDVTRYHGNEYDLIFIDEATHFTEEQFQRIYPSSRGANNFPHRVYLTTNPGGVGHGWVKRLFIDKEYRDGENPDDYTFIKATVYDNYALLEKDPEYIGYLKSLPVGLREAWLNGDWDLLSGQFFTEFDERIHVIQPRLLHDHWRRYVTIDYGLDMAAIYWIAVDELKRCYIYRELHEPNLNVHDCAEKIKSMTGTGERIYMYLAPKDLFGRQRETGKSTADIFQEHGISLSMVNNDRVSGWLAVKEALRVEYDHNGYPITQLKIFNTCHNLIKYLPLLQFDDKKVNDIATKPHLYTHSADSLRYFCSYWISAANDNAPEKKVKLIDKLMPKKRSHKRGILA